MPITPSVAPFPKVYVTITDASNPAFGVVIDASLREGHEKTSVISKYPIETGAQVADHVRPNPNVLKLRGIVSATPEETLGETTGRVDQARSTIIGFRNSGTLLEIQTAKELYKNMVITSLVEPVDVTNANDFEFDMTAEQLSTVNTAFVQAPAPKNPTAATNTKLGPKVPSDDASQVQSGFAAIAKFGLTPVVPQ
jgi:hypothetical protein